MGQYEWKNININIQNIEYDTGSSTLIKMPNKSQYAGYKFWHPSKLVRNGRNSYSASIGYNDNFEFTLRKYGNGKHNRSEVLDEITIDVSEFEEAFDCMSDCTRGSDSGYLIIEEPKKAEINTEVEEELKNE